MITAGQLLDLLLDTSEMTDAECEAELRETGVDVDAARQRMDEMFARLREKACALKRNADGA